MADMHWKDIDRTTFARWSFEFDRDEGREFFSYLKFEDLECEDRAMYLEEADEYLKLGPDEWPLDIHERLAREDDYGA